MSTQDGAATQKVVLAFGEVLWDMLPSGAELGGAPLNFAYRVSTLGDRSLMVSRLGRDELGQRAWDQITALGMETEYLQWDPTRRTGTVPVALDEDGNPSFYIAPGVAYDYIAPTREVLALAPTVDCVCFSTVAQRSPTSRGTLGQLLTAAGGALKLFDVNLRTGCYTPEVVLTSLERADVLRMNESEAEYLSELLFASGVSLSALCRQIMEQWPLSHCLVTLGERGAYVASAEGVEVYDPGYRVEVVDTVGSGDAFTAGFVHQLLRGEPLARCCGLGNVLGALVATQQGATEPISWRDIEQFMAADLERVVDPAPPA